MVLASAMTTIYILFLESYFPGHSPLVSGPKMAENPKISSIMAAQGLGNRIKVKVIHFKRGPDTSNDDYIHLLSCALFLWTYNPPFWPKID